MKLEDCYIIDEETQCWLWNGQLLVSNNLKIREILNRNNLIAAEYMWCHIYGIPPINHSYIQLCKTVNCINPLHWNYIKTSITLVKKYKIDKSKYLEIQEKLIKGIKTQQLADEYKVSYSTMYKVVNKLIKRV